MHIDLDPNQASGVAQRGIEQLGRVEGRETGSGWQTKGRRRLQRCDGKHHAEVLETTDMVGVVQGFGVMTTQSPRVAHGWIPAGWEEWSGLGPSDLVDVHTTAFSWSKSNWHHCASTSIRCRLHQAGCGPCLLVQSQDSWVGRDFSLPLP